MDGLVTAKNIIINPAALPVRRGKRPITVRGPLHIQCDDYGDERAVYSLLQQVYKRGLISKQIRCLSAVRICFLFG